MNKRVLVIVYLVVLVFGIAGQELRAIAINKFKNYPSLNLTIYPETIAWLGGEVLVIPAPGGLNMLDTKKMEAKFIKTPGFPYIFQAGNEDVVLSLDWSGGIENSLNMMLLVDEQPVFRKSTDFSYEEMYFNKALKWFYSESDIDGYAKIDMENEEIVFRWFRMDGTYVDLRYPIKQVDSAYYWREGTEFRKLPWRFESDKGCRKLSCIFGKKNPYESDINDPRFTPTPDVEFSVMDYSYLYDEYLVSSNYGLFKVSIINKQAYLEKIFSSPIKDWDNEEDGNVVDGALILSEYSYLSIPKENGEQDVFYLEANESVMYALQINNYDGKNIKKIDSIMVENSFLPYTKRKYITNWKKTRLAVVGYNRDTSSLEVMVFAIEKSAIADVDGLRMRDAPNISGVILRKLVKGEAVTVIDISEKVENIDGVSGYWTYVRVSDGTNGWVFGAYLKEADKREY